MINLPTLPEVDWKTAPDDLYTDHLNWTIAWHANWWADGRKRGKSMCGDNYALVLAWAMDFCRAMRERPWWARLLVRVIFGKYAYREFIGLQDACAHVGFDPYFEYSCQEVSYQKNKVPFAWWRERESMIGKGTV